ncbi:flavodoxin family protein [Methanoplanus sp. FWC-SCC4]|uniref:Flavodoxin family protein n=1 Tax=Methanochimaera problematica TaxID=2609417 RepID=A0AA97FE97_9EURY|nr:flavodoxin family protein [Methanoplanus sp. FWC-SCC4]WOF16448.1 flavodoxin family protein [Methanoplanus sp. FWC-SCC4]
MKITGICASPRGKNSNTLALVKEGLKGAKDAGAETELIDICKKDIRYCTGCSVCYETGKCIIKDDFEEILDKLCSSDGIILGSPNYINSVTGQMKTFLDRMADCIHCQRLLGKYGFSVSTAGGSNSVLVAGYLNQTLNVLGADTVGLVSIDIGVDPDLFQESIDYSYNTGITLVNAIKEKRVYPEQKKFHDEMKSRMKMLILANKDNWIHEYDYWKDMGWI